MLEIICWTLIVVFGLLYIICMIGPIATVKEESKNSYLLLLCLFFTLICIFPVKELYSSLVASRMWQISFSSVLFVSILLIIISKENRSHTIITAIISGVFTLLPFYNTLVFSNAISPLSVAAEKIEIRIDYFTSIVSILVCVVLLICSIIILKRTKKTGINYILADLLQQNITMYSNQDSFKKPMETLWTYEANSKLKQLDTSIKKCINEIQQLSQKPFLLNSISASGIDDLRPIIYKMSIEISNLNSLISKNEYQFDLPSEFSVVTELNHSLATPLSQIEVICELLKPKCKGALQPQLERIIQYVNFCRRTILAFKEILSSSIIGDSKDYATALKESFDMYCDKNNKHRLKFLLNAEDNIDISPNILMSIVSPLLENAVTASPDGKDIQLNVFQSNQWINIIMINECSIVPQLDDLKTGGYSSKKNHLGTGLETVRHFLVLLGGKEMKISIENKHIEFNLKFPTK